MNKLQFIFKRPKVVIVTGNARKTAAEAISQVLGRHFKLGREVLIYETDLGDIKKFKFLVKKSRLSILVVTQIGEYHPDKEFFAGDLAQTSEIKKLAEVLPAQSYLILNFDDETVRDIKNNTKAHPLTFGFGARADIKASDIVLTPPNQNLAGGGTNFKINYEGNIVPVWLKKLFGKEQIYAALSAVAAGEVLDLNLVEISGALKFYQGLPGKMRLVEGIKKSWLLDDSENASSLSMLEALEILGKIETGTRKIAVLGDILGIGKYTIEAHESIGEKAAQSADLLFTVGARANFFAQGAKRKGMPGDKIFQFDETEKAAESLRTQIQEGDLILVDGSKEMNMIEVVKEIRAVR